MEIPANDLGDRMSFPRVKHAVLPWREAVHASGLYVKWSREEQPSGHAKRPAGNLPTGRIFAASLANGSSAYHPPKVSFSQSRKPFSLGLTVLPSVSASFSNSSRCSLLSLEGMSTLMMTS